MEEKILSFIKNNGSVVVYFIVECTSYCLWELCVWSMFCNAVHCVLSSFAIILVTKRNGEMAALLCFSSWCFVIVAVLWHFLAVPWVGL